MPPIELERTGIDSSAGAVRDGRDDRLLDVISEPRGLYHEDSDNGQKKDECAGG
jgi:hypothetical protein